MQQLQQIGRVIGQQPGQPLFPLLNRLRIPQREITLVIQQKHIRTSLQLI